MSDPNIEVILTDPHEFYCFKLVFHAKPETPEGIVRYPLELYLHTTQAIDLVHKLSLAICEKHHQDSAELLRVLQRQVAEGKMSVNDARKIRRGDDAPLESAQGKRSVRK